MEERSKMKYKDNGKIYYIEWQDAHTGSGWYDNTEVEKFIISEKCICQEVGWILSETKEELVIACRKLKWAEKTNSSEYGLLQKIPKAWVKKRILLRKI